MRGYEPRVGRLMRWLLVGPVALTGLLAVVVGGPLLLWKFGVNPLPDRMLSTGELVELLTSPDDGQLLLWALSVVGWVAWAVVAGSLLLEVGAQLAGARTPRLPGLGGPQRLAAVLVAGVLTALAAPGISHAHAAYLDAEQVTSAPLLDPTGGPAAPLPVGEFLGPAGVGAAPGVVAPVGSAPGEPGTIGAVAGGDGAADGERPVNGQVVNGGRAADGIFTPTGEPSAEPLVHEVAPGDWMWHIAGRYLGDELRYPEIAALNPEYAQWYEDFPDHIQPGDQLALPPDAYDRGERAHAGGELIDVPDPADDLEPAPEPPPPATAPTTHAPGADPIAPDGAQLEAPPPFAEAPAEADPPSAEVDSPAPAGPDESVPEPQAPPAAPDLGGAPELPAPAAPPAAAAPPAVPAPPSGHSPPPQAAPVPYPPPPGVAAPGDPVPGGDPEPVSAEERLSPSLAPLLTSGVLASVLIGALLLYRWRKMSRRRHRRGITDPADAVAEQALRAAATTDVTRLDQALRVFSAGLAAKLADPVDPLPHLPDLGAVWIGEGEIHLILASPSDLAPPAPFHRGGPGSWFLPVDADLPEVDGVIAPLPALVTVGSRPGQHLLVDLERMGMLTVAGPAERVSDLFRYLVAELAHNPWSERAEVTLVGGATGSAQALAALNPERVRVADSLAQAVAELRQRLVHQTTALSACALSDAMHGRVTDTAADTWAPHLLLVEQPGPDDHALLVQLESALREAGRRSGVAVVVGGSGEARYGRSITITSDGLLKAAFLDDSHAIPAVALPEPLLAPLVELIQDAAVGPDHPIPPAREHWAAGTDATGGQLPVDAPAVPEPSAFAQELPSPFTSGEVAASSSGPGSLVAVEPLPGPELTDAWDGASADTAEEPAEQIVTVPVAEPAEQIRAAAVDLSPELTLAAPTEEPPTQELTPAAVVDPAWPPAGLKDRAAPPRRAVEAAGGVSTADPDLDELWAAWHRADDHPPRLGLLGPIQLAVPGRPPTRRRRVCQELIVYLAVQGPAGADAREISRHLWPDQPVRPTDRTDVIMNVRRWLGNGPDGAPWLSEAVPDGRYRLRDGVLVDWHLFRRLRARGERRGAAGAQDLRSALSLVRGAPLADADELANVAIRVPYSWLPGSAIEPDLIVAGVVDTAHQLVNLSLAVDDLTTAKWAVGQAWLADPRRGDDHPWRDLLRIADAERDHDQLEAVTAELLRWRDVEHPDELTPPTRELVRSLLPRPVNVGGGR